MLLKYSETRNTVKFTAPDTLVTKFIGYGERIETSKPILFVPINRL